MRKHLTFLIAMVLIVTSLFISCNNDPINDNATGDVRFMTSTSTTRALNSLNPKFDASNLVWKYEAKKVDNSGLKTGETTGKTLVGEDGKISNAVGPFSLGDWEFKLYAYNDMEAAGRDEVAYTGTANATIVSSTGNSVSITVNALKTEGKYGTIAFPPIGGISLNDEWGNSVSEFKETITIVDAVTNQNAVDPLINSSDRLVSVPSGAYKVTVKYSNPNNEAMVYGENSIYVNVWDYLTTTIGGSLDEITGNTTFNPTDGTATSDPVIIQKDQATNIAVNSTPMAPEGDESGTTKTSVDFPAGVLTGQGAMLEVKAYTVDTVGDFVVSEEKAVIAGLDISLTVDEAEKTEFSSPVTVTTYIAKGLTNPTVKYNGDSKKDQPTEIKYDSSTGEISFKTTHFSEFYVTSDDVAQINDIYYTTFEAAYDNANANDTIVLIADYEIPSGSSLRFSIDKDITIDLNRKELSHNNFGFNIASNKSLTIMNGDLILNGVEGKHASGAISINDGASLSMNSVVLNTNLSGIMPKNGSKLEIVDSKVYAKGAYGVATNNTTGTGVSINIENSYIEAICSKYYGTALCLNTNASSSITVKNSTLKGQIQSVMVRGFGSATFEDTTFEFTNEWILNGGDDFNVNGWASGNCVASAPIVIGSESETGYQSDSIVVIRGDKTAIVVPDGYDGDLIYMRGRPTYNTSLDISGAKQFNGEVNVGHSAEGVSINGTDVSNTGKYSIINGEVDIPILKKVYKAGKGVSGHAPGEFKEIPQEGITLNFGDTLEVGFLYTSKRVDQSETYTVEKSSLYIDNEEYFSLEFANTTVEGSTLIATGPLSIQFNNNTCGEKTSVLLRYEITVVGMEPVIIETKVKINK